MKTRNFISPSHPKAKALLISLNKTLLSITGDDGTSSYDDKHFNPDTDIFVLIEVCSEPIGCGAFRYFDDRTCEIKRMFSLQKGIGHEILQILEKEASKLGYRQTILSTRRKNKNAVSFYSKNGFKPIPAYGKYKNNNKSICLGKQL